MGAAAASPAATSPVNIKALLILASFVELCRVIAVAARMNAPPNRPFGRVFDNWRFLVTAHRFSVPAMILFVY
jgi:hypothetical protein